MVGLYIPDLPNDRDTKLLVGIRVAAVWAETKIDVDDSMSACLTFAFLRSYAEVTEAVEQGRSSARRGDLLDHDEVVERIEQMFRA